MTRGKLKMILNKESKRNRVSGPKQQKRQKIDDQESTSRYVIPIKKRTRFSFENKRNGETMNSNESLFFFFAESSMLFTDPNLRRGEIIRNCERKSRLG